MEEKEEKSSLSPFVVAIVTVAVLVVALIVVGQKRKFEPVVAGTEAIDFALPDLGGNEKTLSDYRGKVVFLNFWATWCKPCEEEMPSMQRLYKNLKDRPFEMVAVSVDRPGIYATLKRSIFEMLGVGTDTEDYDVVREFVEKRKLTFIVLHDRKGRVRDIYKTTGVPETFIIDQNGVIAEKVWGPRDWSRSENTKVIVDLLSNGPKPAASYLEGEKGQAKVYQ
jgi:peroxiredoxin